VIGAGFAGLSTALHLAEAGVSVVVLESHEPGWGGSGRNGGQVIPGIKYDPSEILAKFGPVAGEALIGFVGSTADLVFDLIAKHGMDVPHRRAGWIQGAHTPAMVETVKRRSAEWQARGVDAQFLDHDAAASLLGTDRYLAGWVDRRAGGVQPLAYARGLAKAALAAGAAIHGQSKVVSLTRSGATWTVRTTQGATVTAPRVVVATNGYTGDLIPKLRQTVIRPNSFIVATQPLSDNVAGTILPEGQVVSDTRQLLLYFRKDHQNRLLMGGRGPFREPKDAADWAHLERVVGKMYPQLKGVPFDFRWCGRVALTRDFLPHLHEPEPGLLRAAERHGQGDGGLHRHRRQGPPALPGRADHAAAPARAERTLRLGDHRLVPPHRWRHEGQGGLSAGSGPSRRRHGSLRRSARHRPPARCRSPSRIRRSTGTARHWRYPAASRTGPTESSR